MDEYDPDHGGKPGEFTLEQMGEFRRGTLNFKELILDHLTRISFLTTRFYRDGINRDVVKSLMVSVSTLEQLLYPYTDDEYKKEKNELRVAVRDKKKFKEYVENKHELGIIPIWSGNADHFQFEMQNIMYSLIHLSLIQKLLARKGLLLEGETETQVRGKRK